jgi:cobaltochelatase CobN
LTTPSRAIASVLVCNGCCCGHTEKGKPPLPKARIEAAWKDQSLGRAVRLRFVDCLGPCSEANVAVVKTATETIWLAALASDQEYEELAAWAKQSALQGTLSPLPASLLGRRIPAPSDE